MKNKVTSLEGGVVCSRGTRGKADYIVPKSFAAWRALIQSQVVSTLWQNLRNVKFFKRKDFQRACTYPIEPEPAVRVGVLENLGQISWSHSIFRCFTYRSWWPVLQLHSLLSKHWVPVGRELWWNRRIRECHGPLQCLSSWLSEQCYLHLALFLKPRKLRKLVKSFMWLWESRFLWEYNATVGWHLLCNIIF